MTKPVSTGELLMLSTEEYSDQSYSGPYKALCNFDMDEIASVVSQLKPEQTWKIKTGPDDVIWYLRENGFIQMLDCKDFHLGSYGNIKITGGAA